MKYKIEQIEQGDDELILRYQKLNQEVEYIMNFMSSPEKKLVGFNSVKIHAKVVI